MTSRSTLCATMMINGRCNWATIRACQLFRRGERGVALGDHRALRHDDGCPRDRIGEIEVVKRATERSLLQGAAARGKRRDMCPLGGGNLIDALQLGMRLE